ncbi:hypothetical protein ISS37_07355 [candidate division KSB1 bacterium]|nr:hypothetical protein [candidate division KSB1 bacterium]
MAKKQVIGRPENPNYPDFLRTELQKGKPKEVENKRIKRISEALSWEAGPSLDSPKKHAIITLPNGVEVYFLKPGKEVFKSRNPNPNDMIPCVGHADEPYGFDTVWKQLSKISVYDFEIFRAVLTLIYRNAYLLDHVEDKKGIIRYKPSQKIADSIQELEKSISDLMEYGLLGFLHFMDILGWNEDVKYNVKDGRPTFRKDWKTGRLNTLLTCITIPYKTYQVVKNIQKHSSKLQEIDWSLVYDIMQRLLRTRGICPPQQSELLEWLSPYIIKDVSQQKLL